MHRQNPKQKSDLRPHAPMTVGLALAALWALHAAATHVPGAGYVRFPIVFGIAGGLILWRMFSSRPRAQFTHKNGITVALCCWGVAATLSTVLNWQTEFVPLTFLSVFVAGALVYVAFSGLDLTSRDLDLAIGALAVGTMVTMVAGLAAFIGEWGVPDLGTVITAWQNLARMESYSDATFGNRGNTAGFILIVVPIMIATLLDKQKGVHLRALCGATLVPIALNLLVIQVRAAFLTMFAVIAVVSMFKLGARRLPLFVAVLVLAVVLLFKYEPDAGFTVTERLMSAVTVDAGGDESVQGRVDAIHEGWLIASRNWLLGIGPGGALTVHSRESAHQFQVQQAMETGVLGFVGVILLSIGIMLSMARVMAIGRHDEINDIRFMLLIGPAAFVLYSVIANAALNNASVNTWTVLVSSMLALMPPFKRRVVVARRRSAMAIMTSPNTADAIPV